MPLTATSSGFSNAGRAREHNQDALLADDELGLYAVSDGMGGDEVGHHASALTAELVLRAVRDERALLEGVRAGYQRPRKLEALLRDAVLAACAKVYGEACADPEMAGMGATLTLLAVAGSYGVVAHVGHSRLYLMRNNTLSQLSNDHTFSAELGRADAPFDLADEQSADVLSRAIGMQPSVAVDTLVFELLPGDRFLICSDGYSRYLQDEAALVTQLIEGEPRNLARQLVEAANVAGGEDNVTCVVVAIDSDNPDDKRSSAILERYNALSGIFLFKDLGWPLLARVVSRSQLPKHEVGDLVIKQGVICDELMVVLEGQYELLRDNEPVGKLTSGDHAGETLLFNPRPARATIRALTEGRMLRLAAAELKQLLRERPWLGMGLLQRLGARLSEDLDRSYTQREGSLERTLDGEQF